MKTKLPVYGLLVVTLAWVLTGRASLGISQMEPKPPYPMAQLKNALETAGAPALTSSQETAIQALLTDFRKAHRAPRKSATQTARAAYETAILNGDLSAAAAQAETIGVAEAADIVQRETDAAALAINLLSILKADAEQYNALIAKMGSSGVVRLALGIAGGPRGGPGGPGPKLPPPQ
jgi:hypothetical protein